MPTRAPSAMRRILFCAIVTVVAVWLLAVPRMAVAQACTDDAACGKFQVCVGRKCCTPTDFTNKCGGDCGVSCPDSGVCSTNTDCQSGACSVDRCCGPSCNGNCSNRCK